MFYHESLRLAKKNMKETDKNYVIIAYDNEESEKTKLISRGINKRKFNVPYAIGLGFLAILFSSLIIAFSYRNQHKGSKY